MWRRRDFARWAAAAWVSGSHGVAFSTNEAVAPRAPVRGRAPLGSCALAVHLSPQLCYLPLIVAQSLGYFRAEGLDLSLLDMGHEELVMQSLSNGSVQVASGPYSQTIGLQLTGRECPAFVLQGQTPQIVLGVSLRQAVPVRRISDLRGRRIAVSALGSSGHRMARLLLDKAGVAAQDVSFEALADPSAARSAVILGEVDALCYHDPLITQLERDGALRVLVDTRTARASAEVFGGPWPTTCLFASADFVSQQPTQCQAMANAMVRALKWLQTAGPSDLIRAVPESLFHGDRALFLAAFTRARESWAADGLMPEGGALRVLRHLALFGDAPLLQRVDLSKTYTNRFAQAAKLRYRL